MLLNVTYEGFLNIFLQIRSSESKSRFKLHTTMIYSMQDDIYLIVNGLRILSGSTLVRTCAFIYREEVFESVLDIKPLSYKCDYQMFRSRQQNFSS